MARQDTNQTFLDSAFLYGGNAGWIEELYARYAQDPNAVEAGWRAFFAGLKDRPDDVVREARGAPWKRDGWPIAANGELVAALTGDWEPVAGRAVERVRAEAHRRGVDLSDAQVLQAARDSVRAIMMVRAYRMRGHLHADLDPLGLAPQRDHEELHPSSYGFGPED